MTTRKQPQDLTELLFLLEEPSREELAKYELYQKATQEAFSLVGSSSPMALLRKTEEIYKKYLGERK
jgi:hypothetical protein